MVKARLSPLSSANTHFLLGLHTPPRYAIPATQEHHRFLFQFLKNQKKIVKVVPQIFCGREPVQTGSWCKSNIGALWGGRHCLRPPCYSLKYFTWHLGPIRSFTAGTALMKDLLVLLNSVDTMNPSFSGLCKSPEWNTFCTSTINSNLINNPRHGDIIIRMVFRNCFFFWQWKANSAMPCFAKFAGIARRGKRQYRQEVNIGHP